MDTDIEDFRRVTNTAIQSHELAFAVLSRLTDQVGLPVFSCEDVSLLCKLIQLRIHPVLAFGVLSKIDHTAAVSMLLSRYLGTGVSPDTKHGGYESELWIMLSDLAEVGGEPLLRELVRHDEFNRDAIFDGRVLRSFAESLGLDEDEAKRWLISVTAGTKVRSPGTGGHVFPGE